MRCTTVPCNIKKKKVAVVKEISVIQEADFKTCLLYQPWQ